MPGITIAPAEGAQVEERDFSLDGAVVALSDGYEIKLRATRWRNYTFKRDEGFGVRYEVKHTESTFLIGRGYLTQGLPDMDSAEKEKERLSALIERGEYDLELDKGGKIVLKVRETKQ